MPTTPRSYESRPYVRPAYEPDTRTLLQLMQMAGASRANAAGQKGQARAQGLMTLGQILSQGLGNLRQEGEQRQALAFKQAEADRDEQFRRDELTLRKEEREADRTARQRLEQRQIAAEDRAAAMEAVENTMPGPIDPTAASTMRKFPGTAPLVSQQTALEARPVTNDIAGLAGTANRRRALSGPEEAAFQRWYAPIAAEMGLDADPDSPAHQYDYRGAYRAGVTPDESTHWPSTFKQGDHPNVIVDGMDTRTMTAPPAAPTQFSGQTMRTTPDSFAVRGMTPKEERQARIDAQAQADREADNARQLAAANKPPQPTTASLAERAAAGDKNAERALEILLRQRAPQPSENQPLVPIVGPDGKTRYGTREEARGQIVPSGQNKPATGLEKRALAFFNRADQADKDLESMETEIQRLNLSSQAWMAMAPNFAQTDVGQRYTQAQRAFTEARLRKDSGAAIPDAEFDNDRKTYFVQPGDSPETLEQKRRARAAILASLGFESGQALGEFVGDADEARRMVDSYKTRAAKPQAGGSGKVRMQAPDGSTQEVDAAMVEHYKGLGAKVVK